MCDYSLYGIENRLAEEGEVLVVHRFHSGSKGLTSPEYLEPTKPPNGWMVIFKRMFAARSRVCAVCIPDGAQLVLHGILPTLQQTAGIGLEACRRNPGERQPIYHPGRHRWARAR